MSAALTPPQVVLRGTGRGLEIVIEEGPPLYEVIAELEARLTQSPGFFAGAEATVWLGARGLPPGGLAHLKAVTDRYQIKIASLRSDREDIHPAAANLQIPVIPVAAPVGPAAVPPGPGPAAPAPGAAAAEVSADGARMMVGPVRSGGLLEAPGHMTVVGDVNAGAELRAGGNIVVMGALRGLAHAACGGDVGYILALRLEAQQLRIGGLIARAGDPDASGRGVEIAYAADGRIVVEPYQGRLPSGFSAARR